MRPIPGRTIPGNETIPVSCPDLLEINCHARVTVVTDAWTAIFRGKPQDRCSFHTRAKRKLVVPKGPRVEREIGTDAIRVCQ